MGIQISGLGAGLIRAIERRRQGMTERIPTKSEINNCIRLAVDKKKLVDYLAEALTCKPAEAKAIIAEAGFGYLADAADVDRFQIDEFSERIIAKAKEKFGTATKTLLKPEVSEEVQLRRIDSALRNTFDNAKLVGSLARELAVTEAEAADILKEAGALDIAAAGYSVPAIVVANNGRAGDQLARFQLLGDQQLVQYIPGMTFGVAPAEFNIPQRMHGPLKELFAALPEMIAADSLPGLYREGIMAYYRSFMAQVAPRIDAYIQDKFGNRGPKYIVNSGIGANEQSNHAVAKLNNKGFYYNQATGVYWIMADSPEEYLRFIEEHPEIAADMSTENTLFMEFSRSGKTEETVKLHEFTPREFNRIVFANSGPLREIGQRDNNLVLDLPDDVSGRFGFSRTPILLAPMHVARMDTAKYWGAMESMARGNDFTNPLSFATIMSCFIYLAQMSRPGTNGIYFGVNQNLLMAQADSLIQFWMEGVLKPSNLGTTNDITISRYLGLPRDAHLTLEGILANAATKIGLFILDTSRRAVPAAGSHLVSQIIDPINGSHAGMYVGDENLVLAGANVQTFKELGIPTILMATNQGTTIGLEQLAALNMLFADVVLAYAKLLGIDPGSNPAVKNVRDVSAIGLAKVASGQYDLLHGFHV